MEENLAVTKPALMGGEVQEFKNFSQYEANVKHSRNGLASFSLWISIIPFSTEPLHKKAPWELIEVSVAPI